MISKLTVRLLIVFLYFIIDMIYTFLRTDGAFQTSTLIEKSLLFLGISISVYLITKREEKREN